MRGSISSYCSHCCRYQGILGSFVGLGNTIGPFLAAGFIQTATWRALFWFICPLAVVAGVLVGFVLPPSIVHGDLKTKIKVIDYLGILLSSSAVMLLLIPISGGGTYFQWNSPVCAPSFFSCNNYRDMQISYPHSESDLKKSSSRYSLNSLK